MNQEEDGNDETTNGRHDEQWDLTSPLLLQSNNRINQGGEQTNQCSLIPTDDDNDGGNNMNQQLLQHSNNYMGEEGKEGEEEEEDTAVLITADKNEYYQTLLAAIFTMSFIILVSGSYFFEWSDTVLKVQINQLLARTTRNDDDDAYTNNNVTTDDNINIRADGDENKFDFGETMSVNLVSVLIKITKVSFRYIVILYNNVIYSMPTVQYCFTQQLYQSLLFLI